MSRRPYIDPELNHTLEIEALTDNDETKWNESKVRRAIAYCNSVNDEKLLGRLYSALSRLVEKKVKIYNIFGQEIPNQIITYDYLLNIAGFNYAKDKVIKFLLDNGASPNVTNYHGRDLLNYITRNLHWNPSLLLEKEVELDVADKNDGLTPLMYILSLDYPSKEQIDLAKLLIAKGSRLDLSYKNGQTLLIRAIFIRCDEITKTLIEKGVKLDPNKASDVSPLMIALGLGQTEIARLLIAKGANTNFKNEDGQNAKMFLAQRIILEDDAGKKEELKKLFIEIVKKSKADVSKEESEKLIELYLAEMMLRMSYSENNFGQLVSMTKLFSKTLPNLNLDESHQKPLEEIFLRLLNDREFVRKNDGRKFKVITSKISEHRSYFLLESDENNKPLFIHYIDGNCPFHGDFYESAANPLVRLLPKAEEENDTAEREETFAQINKILKEIDNLFPDDRLYFYGAAKFKINDRLNYNSHHFEVVLSLITDLKKLRDELFSSNYEKDIDQVTTIEGYLPTKPQERDNCSFKSDLLLVGAILDQAYGLGSKLVDGKPAGEGYEIRKTFKHALIEYYAKQVTEMADPANKKKVFYDEACKFLKEVIKPNAAKKLEVNTETPNSSAFKTAQSIQERIGEWERKSRRAELYDQPWWRVEVRELSKNQDLSIKIKESAASLLKGLGYYYAKEADKMIKRPFGIVESDLTLRRQNAIAPLEKKYQEAQEFLQTNPQDKDVKIELMALSLLLMKDSEKYQNLKKEFLKDQTPSTSTETTLARAAKEPQQQELQ